MTDEHLRVPMQELVFACQTTDVRRFNAALKEAVIALAVAPQLGTYRVAVLNLPTYRETLFGMAEGPALYEGQRLYLKRSEVLAALAGGGDAPCLITQETKQ